MAPPSEATSCQNPTTVHPLEETTFQDCIRREWIQAVFGTNFPNKGEGDIVISSSAWKGVGLANIPSYATYTVQLPLLRKKYTSQQSIDHDEKKEMSVLRAAYQERNQLEQ